MMRLEVNDLHEIGSQLRAAREARQITLEQAEEETKIRKKYLEALEDGRPDILPGEVYVKGFLRSYANYLGLDGDALLASYKQSTGGAVEQQEAAEAAPEGGTRVGMPSRRAARDQGRRSSMPYMLAGGLLALALVAYLLYRQFGVGTAKSPVTTTAQAGSGQAVNPQGGTAGSGSSAGSGGSAATGGTQQGDTKTGGSPVSTAPGNSGGASGGSGGGKITMHPPQGRNVLFALPGTGKIDVALEYAPNTTVWIQATVDGKVYMQNKASTVQWSGSAVTIEIGHANGLKAIVVNGQRFEQPLKGGPFTLKFVHKG
jgi:cytoskeletal protein RodZ